MNDRLGSRALGYFRVWIIVLIWTVVYSEGAGFGAALYRNECAHLQGGPCPLVYQHLFPPQITVPSFINNLATLWVDGVYDSGLLFAVLISIALVLLASRMTWYTAERALSWRLTFVGCVVFVLIGFFYEVHQTLSTGIAGVPLL